MLAALRERRNREDEGFTLIELMVVVLIIAILLAIAIPTFLGAQDRARDRGAQSNLRNSLTAAKTIATDTEGIFTTVSAASLNESEPSLTHQTTALGTSASKVVKVVKGNGNLSQSDTATVDGRILLVSRSASGKYFGLCADYKGAVLYNPGNTTEASVSFANCTAEKF